MFGFIPHNEAKQTVFFGTDTGTWQTWTKPAGISYVAFTIIGGGGGSGRSQTSSNGGAGSGGVTTILLPSAFLPDTVFIRAGSGGIGATFLNGNGTAGGVSYVAVYPSTTAAYVLGYANGGPGGGASQLGSAGATIASIASMPLATGFYYNFQAGLEGSNGSTFNSNGTNITLGALCLSGGAGGGYGSGFTGGSITGSGIIPTIPGGATNAPGGAGVWFWKGFKGCGGAGGGGGAASGTGGAGGNGAYGCGGGGGGGAGGGGAGQGGNGGQGLVVVHYW